MDATDATPSDATRIDAAGGDATPQATASRANPVLPVLIGWLLPGAGHLAIGRPWPGIFVAAAIWPLFAAGMVLAGFENVGWERHPYLFCVQVFAGVPTGAAALLTRSIVLTEHHAQHTVGDLFTCAAGLLNIVAIADVWARCTAGDPEERLARKRAEEAAAHAVEESGEPLGAESLVRSDAPQAPDAGADDAGDAGPEASPRG